MNTPIPSAVMDFAYTEAPPHQPISTVLNGWQKLIETPSTPMSVEVIVYGWRSHHRGRFIHSHKGKQKRQHPLRTQHLVKVSSEIIHNVGPFGTVVLPAGVEVDDEVVINYPHQP